MDTPRDPLPRSLDEIVQEWQKQDVRAVLFELPDMHGMSRSKLVSLAALREYARTGLNMYGGTVTADTSSDLLPGTLYNEERRYADALLRPDLATAAEVPWLSRTARLICDAYWQDGSPLQAAPRQVLRSVLAELEKLGYQAVVGLEYEFYLLDRAPLRPVYEDRHIFNSLHNVAVPAIERMLELMPQIGVDVITANCEYGSGQYEINYGPHAALQACDLGFTFKNGVKMIASQMGTLATFMTKPFSDQAGSGAHTHLSLLSRQTQENAFLDEGDQHGLSPTAYHFIGGMLQHAPAVMALAAPTPNCYHRFVPHAFAPTGASWGVEDRSATVRVTNSRDQRPRLENRLPTALSNPYLATAAVIAAGLLGLREAQMPPGLAPGTVGGPPSAALPMTLEEALLALERDKDFCSLLGQEFVHIFVTTKRGELSRFHAHVSNWERQEYLEAF